jgi:hypothetical protein
MKITQLSLLAVAILTGISLYFSLPHPQLQKCIMLQYDLSMTKIQRNGELQPILLSTTRMICSNIDKNAGL